MIYFNSFILEHVVSLAILDRCTQNSLTQVFDLHGRVNKMFLWHLLRSTLTLDQLGLL